MTLPPTNIVLLGRDRFDAVVETLCAAFYDYPVMRYVLKGSGDAYDEHLRELVGWFTDKRLARGWPVLGVVRGGRLLGAANIDPPQALPEAPELKARFERFKACVGNEAMARFEGFADACAPLTPKEPHHYLGMLGVRPEDQGQGIGRLLLETVQAMSAKDPDSHGVALTTETPTNLPFYELFGYQIVGRSNAEELETWTLFRRQHPNDPMNIILPIL